MPKQKEGETEKFLYPVLDTIRLERTSEFPSVDILTIIEERRSTRNFRKRLLQEIGDLLWLSVKVRNIHVQDNGYILSQRPSASAGARHPIDIIVVYKNEDESSLAYYYNPFEHSLQHLGITSDLIDSLQQHLNESIKIGMGTVLWFIAHPTRTEAKYENAQSLIWRDAGALVHSIQIACATLGYNSCPVGTLGDPFLSNLFTTDARIFGVGGIIIG